MRPNDRGTESRLGMGHRGLDEEGEKEQYLIDPTPESKQTV